VAVADGERGGEVRFFGDISSEPGAVATLVAKLAKGGAKLHFCYEAGPLQGTIFIARSSGSVTSAWWLPHRWCRSDRVTG